ncbi:hypothetical protein GXW74_01415 [Roseomonas eburnea]|uniref:Uncharacterized protein n=1 Tax=Neoroseomonas eburnea TaxID=1346889 RepID=A0A9X9X5Z3_9PROT|nr:hypothetical protein [Neoroseomonas eburnea]MBR0679129.1 hypothetical protein [Neoroseomonas eburnea]
MGAVGTIIKALGDDSQQSAISVRAAVRIYADTSDDASREALQHLHAVVALLHRIDNR